MIKNNRVIIFLYSTTIFISAFLLFQIQPIIAKYILPWFGGSSSVWIISMLFFQIMLLLGYLYAHLIIKILKPRWQAFITILLLVIVLSLLPITLPDSWKPTASDNASWHILLMLTFVIGLPFFILSSTAPLLQAWYSCQPNNKNVYNLYGLSNLAAILALLTYPFIIEPAWQAKTQIFFWSWLYLIFAFIYGFIAFNSITASEKKQDREKAGKVTQSQATRPKYWHYVLWLCLSFCGVVLLLSITNRLTLDLAAVPFLWILPLAIYLFSFVLCFNHRNFYQRKYYYPALFFCLFIFCLQLTYKINTALVWQIIFLNIILFVFCMFCNGELYNLRPKTKYLTNFYVLISLGGVIGGIFVGLIAPVIFKSYAEFYVGLLFCYFLAVIIFMSDNKINFFANKRLIRIYVYLFLLVLTTSLINCVYLDIGRFWKNSIYANRNFYGILNVLEYNKDLPSEHRISLVSGTINHGLQYVLPEKKDMPITYYSPQSGVGLLFNNFKVNQTKKVGILGLGGGSLALYGQPGDTFVFYELNPQMVEVANNYFTCLADSQATTDIYLGDARLTLENQDSQDFDIIVLDAFTSDSIPVHLLTKEAFAIYLRNLNDEGVLALHITNSYLDLLPVVLNLANEYQLNPVWITADGDINVDIYNTSWVLLTKNSQIVNSPEIQAAAQPINIDFSQYQLWTDQYTSLFPYLK